MKQKKGSYNKTKKRVLEVLEDKTWIDVPAFAHKVGIRPVRRAYAYLAQLENLGLVTRGCDAPGKLHFRITQRGLDRLEWLRRRDTQPLLEDLVGAFLR